MRESQYTSSVANLLPPSVYHLKVALSFTGGVPDSWYSGTRADLWVEWKYFAVLPLVMKLTDGKKPKITQLQQDWLSHRFIEGRNVAVIVASARGGVILPSLTWQRSLTRTEYLLRVVSKAELAQWITHQCVNE